MTTPDTEKLAKKLAQEPPDEEELPSQGCGILGRYPVVSVLLFAAVGIGCGVGLSFWEPDDPETKGILLKWLGLIGDLFIRALKCVVLPLVFINVVISIMDMMTVGKAGSIGWKTVGLYLLTTVLASILGIISIVCFKGLFEQGDFEDTPPATVSLGCNAEDHFLTEMSNGTVVCTADYMNEEDKEFKVSLAAYSRKIDRWPKYDSSVPVASFTTNYLTVACRCVDH
jgi:hypothetical protein